MKSKLFQKLEQKQKLSPSQILTSKLLHLNQISLEQRIIKEIEQNPALEFEDLLPVEDEEAGDASDDFEGDELELDAEIDFEDDEVEGFERFDESSLSGEDVGSYVVPSKLSISDKLLSQFQDLNSGDIEIKIAREIIGNLDDGGYLAIDPIIISDKLQVDYNIVIKVLSKIRSLDPPGMGSRDLRECLLSQLEINDSDQLSYKIIDKFFDDFANRRYEKIQEALGVDMALIKDAMDAISVLNPKPGDGAGDFESQYIRPDAFIEKKGSKWIATLKEGSQFNLRISKSYMELLGHNDTKTSKFAKEKIGDAKMFMGALESRKNTMIKVIQSIIKFQSDYFESEGKKISPLILKQVAKDIKMDISTVSRSTKGKYIQLPWGLVELKAFFSESIDTGHGGVVSSTEIKNMIKEIICSEDKRNPLSDEKITSILSEDGYKIARRTVAKYREKIGILRAKMRREI